MKDLSKANDAVDRIAQLFKLQNEWRTQVMRQMSDLMTVIIAQRELINKLSRHNPITEPEHLERLISLAQRASTVTEEQVDSLQDEALDVLMQMSILRRK